MKKKEECINTVDGVERITGIIFFPPFLMTLRIKSRHILIWRTGNEKDEQKRYYMGLFGNNDTYRDCHVCRATV